MLRIRAEAATTGQTGVEMEALTAASVAALTVYDMVKGVERGVEIRCVRLVSKTGGKTGDVGPPRSARPSVEPPAAAAPAGRTRRRPGQAQAQGASRSPSVALTRDRSSGPRWS